jgi:POT family proton-dependent oligopeptide transporter
VKKTESQPKGLYILFFAEAWERFSYYGMRALLVLYLVNQLHYKREDALALYGTYTGLVYLTPILGGYLADKLLGRRKAVIIGGTVMALGHLAMAFEPLLHIALGLLIIGNGFFKPNISTIVGGLYRKGDPRRDGGFTIFYMGINLGAFFSPIVCGMLGEKVGWHYGFAAAGVGMVLGLLTFLWGQRFFGTVGFPPHVEATADTRLGLKDWRDIGLFIGGSVAFVVGFLELWKVVGPAWNELPTFGRLAVGAALVAAVAAGPRLRRQLKAAQNVGPDASATSKKAPDEDKPFTVQEWHRIAVIFILCAFVIFFWMGFEQAGGTMTLFADTQTDRHLFGWEIPASLFQSINPLVIVALAPVFSVMWTRLDKSKYALSTPTKMAIGMIVLGLGFVVLYVGQQIANKTGSVGPLWLTAVYFIHTVGELCLSPVGLSMVTKLSPVRIVSLMMGTWFISSAVANYLSATLEGILAKWDVPLYGFLVASSIGAGVLLLLLTPLLKKWMHGAEELQGDDADETPKNNDAPKTATA